MVVLTGYCMGAVGKDSWYGKDCGISLRFFLGFAGYEKKKL